MTCDRCRKKNSCKSPCDELEKAVSSGQGEDPYLVFVDAPREHIQEQEGTYYVSRLPEKDARLLSLYDAFRPLHNLGAQAALVFIGRHYFGMTHRQICTTFKIKERRVYDILRRGKDAMAAFQAGQDLPEPGGDPGEDSCE